MSKLFAWFTNPPKEFSPVPIWWWSGDRLDSRRLRWELERFAEGGVYNLIVLNLAPTSPLYGSDIDDPPFFSEAWWQIFCQVCQDARELGIFLWFYDQIGFSGANLQGELVTRQPAYAAQALERIVQDAHGPVTLVCPDGGSPLAAAAIPIDAAGNPTGTPLPIALTDRQVEWHGSGSHRIMLFYQIERGFDYFNENACNALLQMVHGEFEKRTGAYFGNTIVGSFQDELPSMPMWSRTFAQRFQQLRGYDLLPALAALWEDYGPDAARVRHDFHATRAELAEAAFFKPLFAWHEERKLICGFDQQGPSRTGSPVSGVEQYADYQRTHRWYGAPGSDHHGEAKIHSSLAHLYNRPRVWIESFHSSGWGGTLEETYDWLLPWIRAGANLYNPHAAYYSTHGGWWEWAPPSTDWRQPYWKHYQHFSRTISRLCSVLTLGHHVCDVGILFPSTTIQFGLKLDGADAWAQAAHKAYLQLVGRMVWYDVHPGMMDNLCRDYDILDDASLQRGQLQDASLIIGDERYAVLILPSCLMLEEESAAKLLAFVQAGGKLLAFGELPARADGQGQHIAELIALFKEGVAQQVTSEEELQAALHLIPAPIDAPVPTYIRKVDDATVVFVPATFPIASHISGDNEGNRWTNSGYSFDAGRYLKQVRLKVRDVQGAPLLYEPYSGEMRAVAYEQHDDGVDVVISFEDGPGVLLVWNGEGTPTVDMSALTSTEEQGVTSQTLDDTWLVDLMPTLDNCWGDFALPTVGSSVPLERWEFQHRIQVDPQSGIGQGWHQPDFDASAWQTIHATFGPHGTWTGPAPAADLLKTTISTPVTIWSQAQYSFSRGIYKDAIHMATLGPKGHVPEEFLDFGDLKAGMAIRFRSTIHSPSDQQVYFALGAAASKHIWVNDQLIEDQSGYLLIAPVRLKSDENTLEFVLTAEKDLHLRAHYAFVTNADAYRRPEWMQVSGPWQPEAALIFKKQFSLNFQAEQAALQVGSNVPCIVRVNGEEIGRHGGFDPYYSVNRTRIQPYAIPLKLLRQENTIELELVELHAQVAVIVDGRIEAGDKQALVLSNRSWQALRHQQAAPVVLRREQAGDPSFPLLWRRPHPLPATSWLESGPSSPDVVLPLAASIPFGAGSVAWLRYQLPPGAISMSVALYGAATVYVDGVVVHEHPASNAASTLQCALPHPERAARLCALRVETLTGFEGGAMCATPIRFETVEGKLKLGDWQANGLPGYSGGIRYRKILHVEQVSGQILLDLGTVRGTAEVVVNGQPAGVRIWSPYVFALMGMLHPGENDLQITVYNTLGPYIDAVSPSHYVFPIQKVSGLLGPVRLVREKIS